MNIPYCESTPDICGAEDGRRDEGSLPCLSTPDSVLLHERPLRVCPMSNWPTQFCPLAADLWLPLELRGTALVDVGR